MLQLGVAITAQKNELARLQRETASALMELHKIEQQVSDQRRAKNEAYDEKMGITQAIYDLEVLSNSLQRTAEVIKMNSTKDVEKLNLIHEQIKFELEKKIELLRSKNEKLATFGDLDARLLEKKTELNAEILKFKEESDAIDAKRVKLEKDIEKNKKLKEEAVLQASINKSEKDLIEVQRNELEELKKYYGDILKN